jgi:formylglycine-generating enzyme required for sulfatase activity
MVRLEAADFLVGRRQSSLAGRDARFEELRQVRIEKPFYIAVTETTQAQFAAYMRGSGTTGALGGPGLPTGEKGEDNLPADNVSWEDATSFCKWLSEVEHRRYRLPTRVEWEYACYACTRSASDDEQWSPLGEYAWHRANAADRVHPVASKKANDVGLFDMLGNVWEWCADIVPESLVDATPLKGHVCAFSRGGAYFNAETSCHCSSAYAFDRIDYRGSGHGFRVVCEHANEKDD